VLRKVHSLTGVVPVGVFFVLHLWTNAKAVQGQASFDAAVSDINHLPYLPLIEVVGIFLPLAFHALYGIKLAFESRPNVAHYGFTRNWMYTLQRVTGIVTFAFIIYHLGEFRVPKLMGTMTPDAFYPTLLSRLSTTVVGIPFVALGYLAGVAAASWHFANGLWGFCFSWGLTVSRRSQRLSAGVFGVVGVAIFLLGANSTIYFATGARLFGSGGLGAVAGAPRCDGGAAPPAPSPAAPAPATSGGSR
jgi:succinate dehydrogenase/fumarate reductase cytochrome b subunit (b558 family)